MSLVSQAPSKVAFNDASPAYVAIRFNHTYLTVKQGRVDTCTALKSHPYIASIICAERIRPRLAMIAACAAAAGETLWLSLSHWCCRLAPTTCSVIYEWRTAAPTLLSPFCILKESASPVLTELDAGHTRNFRAGCL